MDQQLIKLLLRTSDPPVWNPKPFWCNVTAAMSRSVKEEAEVCRVILRKYSRLEVCNVCQKDPVPTCHHHIFSFYVSMTDLSLDKNIVITTQIALQCTSFFRFGSDTRVVSIMHPAYKAPALVGQRK